MSINTSILDGLTRTVFGNKIGKSLPSGLHFMGKLKFKHSKKISNEFAAPVVLTMDHSVTYGGAYSDVDDDISVYELNDPILPVIKQAKIRSPQYSSQAILPTAAVEGIDGANERAFEEATRLYFKMLNDGLMMRLELSMMYGDKGIAKASSVHGTVASNATSITLTLDKAETSIGILSILERAKVDLYDGSTKVKDATTSGVFTVSSIDTANYRITLKGAAKDVTALNTTVATKSKKPIILFQGQKGKDCTGIQQIISNSGTLFGINSSSYSVWKGNTYSADSEALTQAKIISALDIAIARGLDGDVEVILNTKTWTQVMKNLASSSLLQEIYKADKVEYGHRLMRLYSQNGTISVTAHRFMKEGYAFILQDLTNEDNWCRVGAKEIGMSADSSSLSDKESIWRRMEKKKDGSQIYTLILRPLPFNPQGMFLLAISLIASLPS